MASDDHGVAAGADTISGVLTISPNPDIHLKGDEDDEGVSVGAAGLLSSQAYLGRLGLFFIERGRGLALRFGEKITSAIRQRGTKF